VSDVARTPEQERLLELARAENFANPQTPEEWDALARLLRPAGTPEVVRTRDEGEPPPHR
jgi:hypothetical protein